jgi:hypothetical protein
VVGSAVEIVVQALVMVSRVGPVGAVLPAAAWLGRELLGKATMEGMQPALGQILALVVVVVQDKLVLLEPELLEEMAVMVLRLLFLAHLLPTQVVGAGAHLLLEMLA